MITKILLTALAIQPLLAADVTEIPLTRYDTSYAVRSAAGEVHLPARHSRLAVILPDCAPRKYEIFVLFDPATGQYLWRHEILTEQAETMGLSSLASYLNGSNANSTLYLSSDRITWFHVAGLDLSISQSSGRARNLDEAYNEALTAFGAHLPDYLHWKIQVIHKVEIWKLVDQRFTWDPQLPVHVATAIENVTRSGDDWILTLQARWKAVLILDSTFHPKSMQRVEREQTSPRVR